jgi:hypothetical protein
MNTQVLTPAKPVRRINFAKILPLFEPVEGTALVPSRRRFHPVTLATRNPVPVVALERALGRHNVAAKLQELPPAGTLSVPRGTGTASRALGTVDLDMTSVADAKLPFGMPRFINAATMKRMLKAKRSELLFRRVGERWEICEDSTQIDLTDDSVEFRLGVVQIFS